MNDKTQDPTPETLDELALLKERARTLGIPIAGNIGIETLRQRVADKINGTSHAETELQKEQAYQAAEDKPKTRAQLDQEIRDRMKLEEMVLIRCRIYNLNPSKSDLQGEIVAVANRYLGTVRKFIPFGEATDNGYHLPRCLLTELQSRKFQAIRTKTVNGQIQVDTRLVPEYNIEILPALTVEELNDLATKQAAAQRLGA